MLLIWRNQHCRELAGFAILSLPQWPWASARHMCPCQTHVPPCLGSARDVMQRHVHNGKDRFRQSAFSSRVESDQALVHQGWRNVIRPAWSGGRGLWIWDPRAFLCLLDNSCQRPTSFRVAHLGWLCSPVCCGRGWIMIMSCQPSGVGRWLWSASTLFSGVFFCSDYGPGLSHFCAASKGLHLYTRSLVLLTCPGTGAVGGRCQSCRWRTGAHRGPRTFLEPRMGCRAVPTRLEKQYGRWKHGLPR